MYNTWYLEVTLLLETQGFTSIYNHNGKHCSYQVHIIGTKSRILLNKCIESRKLIHPLLDTKIKIVIFDNRF